MNEQSSSLNKAFIFDMDGVIVDSETLWLEGEKKFLTELLGKVVYEKIKGNLLGSTIKVIYEDAKKNGYRKSFASFAARYDMEAEKIYAKAPINKNVDILIEKLISLNFEIGLVTSSRTSWINQVLPKFKNFKAFKFILSLGERDDLRSKPFPDGYLEAINKLGSTPKKSIIVEDSNKGIKAAKASGALTVALKQFLPPGYRQEGADLYLNSLLDLIKVLEEIK